MTPFPRQPAFTSHPPFALLATPAHTAAISVTHGWTADRPPPLHTRTHTQFHASTKLFFYRKDLLKAREPNY